MMRGLLLCDGRSDVPLGGILERLCSRVGTEVTITAPDLALLRNPPGHALADRLERVTQLGDDYEIAFVHRDAEAQDASLRMEEVRAATARYTFATVPVVPVRMTEAWLLVDEQAIREVAGRPSGTNGLGLPPPTDVEATPNPKDLLVRALERAGAPAGRRRKKRFRERFPEHRRQLLERLDVDGRVNDLQAWQGLLTSIDETVGT